MYEYICTYVCMQIYMNFGYVWIEIPKLSSASCVMLSKLFNICEPQFLQIKNRVITLLTSQGHLRIRLD